MAATFENAFCDKLISIVRPHNGSYGNEEKGDPEHEQGDSKHSHKPIGNESDLESRIEIAAEEQCHHSVDDRQKGKNRAYTPSAHFFPFIKYLSSIDSDVKVSGAPSFRSITHLESLRRGA